MAHVPTGRPRGRPRKNPVPAVPAVVPMELAATIAEQIIANEPDIVPVEPATPEYPSDWRPGMLLNVRNASVVTLYPEEEDPRHPERALHFKNSADCQNFVSMWYANKNHDPRAR